MGYGRFRWQRRGLTACADISHNKTYVLYMDPIHPSLQDPSDAGFMKYENSLDDLQGIFKRAGISGKAGDVLKNQAWRRTEHVNPNLQADEHATQQFEHIRRNG